MILLHSRKWYVNLVRVKWKGKRASRMLYSFENSIKLHQFDSTRLWKTTWRALVDVYHPHPQYESNGSYQLVRRSFWVCFYFLVVRNDMSMSKTGKSHRLKQDISIPSAVLSGSLLQQIAIRHQREKVAITTLFKMAGVVCLTCVPHKIHGRVWNLCTRSR